jgi:starch-binding outer membrane protein, SusD/RagB family
VERKAYVDASGNPVRVAVTTPDGSTREVNAQGHTVLAFPDGTAFRPNSPFYLFEIPQDEYNNNPNL